MDMLVAETIMRQIHCGVDAHGNTGRHMMMCWGAEEFKGSAEQSQEGKGYLSFKVNGFLFKGEIKISLAWSDTYTIEFIETNGNCITVLHDIYFDELANVIDAYVENEKNAH
jgi:hypothetical protein